MGCQKPIFGILPCFITLYVFIKITASHVSAPFLNDFSHADECSVCSPSWSITPLQQFELPDQLELLGNLPRTPLMRNCWLGFTFIFSRAADARTHHVPSGGGGGGGGGAAYATSMRAAVANEASGFTPGGNWAMRSLKGTNCRDNLRVSNRGVRDTWVRVMGSPPGNCRTCEREERHQIPALHPMGRRPHRS